MFKKVQKGFTLIELMIVIAIIGILAAIAIPAYQNYTIRSQVTEGLSLADGWKTAISEFYAQNGSFPTTSSSSGGPTAVAITASSEGKYVGSIAVTGNGEILVTYSGAQSERQAQRLEAQPHPGTRRELRRGLGVRHRDEPGRRELHGADGHDLGFRGLPAQQLPRLKRRYCLGIDCFGQSRRPLSGRGLFLCTGPLLQCGAPVRYWERSHAALAGPVPPLRLI